nr:YdeI/OmpD-associated family protein [Planococcus sp. ISL-109]
MAERPGVIQYLDAVEEALCFGWIDGTRKKISDTQQLAQRLSLRKKKSNWNELNKERVRRLEKLGWMTEQGLKILPDMHPESFTIDPDIEARLKQDQDAQAYENFLNFPELYRRIRIDNIQGYKEYDRDIFNKRLDKFMKNTKENKMYGQWDDNGRLSDY